MDGVWVGGGRVPPVLKQVEITANPIIGGLRKEEKNRFGGGFFLALGSPIGAKIIFLSSRAPPRGLGNKIGERTWV